MAGKLTAGNVDEVAEWLAFRPPRFLGSGHVQTLLSVFTSGRLPAERAVRRYVGVAGGDRLVLHDDRPASWRPGNRVVMIVHGLGGCHRSGHVVRTASKLQGRGVRTLRLDLRGAGAGCLLARGHYHAGASDDLAEAVEYTLQLCPGSPLGLLGFSMGGLLILRLAAAWGRRAPGPVDRLVTVSPPIDLMRCAANVQRGVRRFYQHYMVGNLLRQLEYRRKHVRRLVDRPLGIRPTSLVEFDRRFTAPVNGFRSVEDYYSQCSVGPLLAQIAVPTLVLAAVDDPLVPVKVFGSWPLSPQVEVVEIPGGGHLGFFSRRAGDRDPHWLEWRLAEWLG